MAPNRRREKAQPGSASNSTHSPPYQRAVGLTTVAGPTGRFRCGVTTIASSRSSTTAQSGGNANGTDYIIAHATRDPAAAQPKDSTTFGPDTRRDTASSWRRPQTGPNQVTGYDAQYQLTGTGTRDCEYAAVSELYAQYQLTGERRLAPPGTTRCGVAQPGGNATHGYQREQSTTDDYY